MKSYIACQIQNEILTDFGSDSLSDGVVFKWRRIFYTIHMSLTNDPRYVRPLLEDNAAAEKKAEDFILLDRRVTFQIIMRYTKLIYGGVWKIIHEELYKSKFSGRGVPRLLNLSCSFISSSRI